jgi:hypothetical protein
MTSGDPLFPPPLWGDDSQLAGYLHDIDLPLEGLPVSGIIQSAGWRDMVESHIGVRPPDADEGDALKKTSGVNTVWLR